MRSLLFSVLLLLVLMCTVSASAQSTHYDAIEYIAYPESQPNWVIIAIKITPKAGWKWNDKYPHKFTAGKILKTLDSHFEKDEKTRIVSFLLLRPKQPTEVTIVGKFSVCSTTSCVVLRDQRFQYKILSTKPTKKKK